MRKEFRKGADKSMGTYNGYMIKQNVDGDIYVLKKSGEKEFFESWKKAHEAIKTGAIKDSLTEDADLIGKVVSYKGMPVKVLRKLTEQEKQERAHLNNPDAGDYYEVEATSKALGTTKFIVWEGRLK